MPKRFSFSYNCSFSIVYRVVVAFAVIIVAVDVIVVASIAGLVGCVKRMHETRDLRRRRRR